MPTLRPLALILAGCAGRGEVAGDEVPTDGAELRRWLDAGGYLGWAAELSVHDGAGPHFGEVRVFVNPALEESLSLSSGEPHPAGAAAVKELWGPEGSRLRGFSAMVKTRDDSDGGDGWYWYERYRGDTYADGDGVGLCTGCHGAGVDYVLTPWPLR